MLELKEIKKYYHVGDTVTKALDGVSVSFRRQEFVAILGASGSGKTTMLNGKSPYNCVKDKRPCNSPFTVQCF